QPPIYRSPVGGRARVASHFRIRRWLPQVRELFLIVFAGQRGCLFPHLRVSYCWIKECRTSLSPATQSLSSIQIEARDGCSERLRGFEIHDQLELGQLLDGEIESVLALNIPELAQARSQRPAAGRPLPRGGPRSLCRTPIRGLRAGDLASKPLLRIISR